MISLDRFRRELGSDCPGTEAEVAELFHQLGVVADVVVASLRGRGPRGPTHHGPARRLTDRRADACGVEPIVRSQRSGAGEAVDRLDERSAIIEYDAKVPGDPAYAVTQKQSRRTRNR